MHSSKKTLSSLLLILMLIIPWLLLLLLGGSGQIDPEHQQALVNHVSYPPVFGPIIHALGGDYPTIPLVEACRRGDLDQVRSLLDAGADPNYTYDHYFTAIEAAFQGPLAEKDSYSIAELLLANGADPSRSESGPGPVFLAAGDLYNASFLTGTEAELRQDMYIRSIALLLDHGANRVDENGDTLLHVAVEIQSLPLVELLAEQYDLDPREENGQGKTPLDLAKETNSTEIIRYLEGLTS